MENKTLDIVALIQTNPISIITNQSKLIEKITSQFSDDDQKLFIASFYVFQNYHKTNDYIIDLDLIFDWIGYSQKVKAKELLVKHFIIDLDYKIALSQMGKRAGGQNKEQILMNIETFKELCILANTERAKNIRKYYIKLEDIIHQTMNEEMTELKQQIESQNLLIKKKDKLIKDMNKKISLDYIYVAVNDGVDNLSKIGITENIIRRNDNHLSSNPGFKYIFTYQSKNNKLIESCVKSILLPFIYNKAEWYNVDSKDLIFIVEFFIDLFDKNNGSEDIKNIIDFITRLKSKNIIERLEQELIPKNLYDEFFNECIDIDENPESTSKFKKPNYKYKCTFVRLQQKIDEWINSNNYNINIKNNHDNYTLLYKNDIKAYIKSRLNKDIQTISIVDGKNNLNLTSYLGFSGFRMKCDYNQYYFEDDIYKRFIDNNLELYDKSRITIKEIIEVFITWLKNNNIQYKKDFNNSSKVSYLFREEFTNAIENYCNLKANKKITTPKYHGYSGFIGLQLKINQ